MCVIASVHETNCVWGLATASHTPLPVTANYSSLPPIATTAAGTRHVFGQATCVCSKTCQEDLRVAKYAKNISVQQTMPRISYSMH